MSHDILTEFNKKKAMRPTGVIELEGFKFYESSVTLDENTRFINCEFGIKLPGSIVSFGGSTLISSSVLVNLTNCSFQGSLSLWGGGSNGMNTEIENISSSTGKSAQIQFSGKHRMVNCTVASDTVSIQFSQCSMGGARVSGEINNFQHYDSVSRFLSLENLTFNSIFLREKAAEEFGYIFLDERTVENLIRHAGVLSKTFGITEGNGGFGNRFSSDMSFMVLYKSILKYDKYLGFKFFNLVSHLRIINSKTKMEKFKLICTRYVFGNFNSIKVMLRTITFTILVFAGIYCLLANTIVGHGIQSNGEMVRGFGDAVYFSMITFATVGYGDILPIGAGAALASIEGIVGVFLTVITGFVIQRELQD